MICAPSEDSDQPKHPLSLKSSQCTQWVAKDPMFHALQMSFCWFCHEMAHFMAAFGVWGSIGIWLYWFPIIAYSSTLHMSRLATKPTYWHVCPAKTPISLGIRPVWSESSLCTQWVAKDPSFLHADSEDSDQTGRMPRLIRVFAGRTTTLLVLSWGGSFEEFKLKYWLTCIQSQGRCIQNYCHVKHLKMQEINNLQVHTFKV